MIIFAWDDGCSSHAVHYTKVYQNVQSSVLHNFAQLGWVCGGLFLWYDEWVMSGRRSGEIRGGKSEHQSSSSLMRLKNVLQIVNVLKKH